MTDKCATTTCDNEAGKTGYCKNCRSSWYYWKKKRPAQVLVRRGKLTLYKNRLGEFFDDEGKKR